MSNILERVQDGSLRTASSWREKTGIHPAVLIEVVKEHWVWGLVAGLAALVGLTASVKTLL